MAVLKCVQDCKAETAVVNGKARITWFEAGAFWRAGETYVLRDSEAYALFERFGDSFEPDDEAAQNMKDALKRNREKQAESPIVE